MENNANTTPSAVLTVKQAADFLGLAVSTLNKWRCHGGGPAFLKLGRSVRYRELDLINFLEESLKRSSS